MLVKCAVSWNGSVRYSTTSRRRFSDSTPCKNGGMIGAECISNPATDYLHSSYIAGCLFPGGSSFINIFIKINSLPKHSQLLQCFIGNFGLWCWGCRSISQLLDKAVEFQFSAITSPAPHCLIFPIPFPWLPTTRHIPGIDRSIQLHKILRVFNLYYRT